MERVAGSEGSYGAFLTRLLARLDELGIRYCVPRNFEGLPDRFEGDVDLLIEPGRLRRVEAAVDALCDGYVVLRRVSRNGHRQLWIGAESEFREALREERAASVLVLDLVTRLQWWGVPYLDSVEVLAGSRTEGGLRVSGAAHRASHILCHALLDKGTLKAKYRRDIEAAAEAAHADAADATDAEDAEGQGARAFAPLAGAVGAAFAARLWAAFRSGDDAGLLRLRGPLERRLLLQRGNALPAFAGFALRKALRIAAALLAPPGVLIATAGPDGCGKTTLLDRLAVALGDTFEPVRSCYMGWRQFLLPSKRVLAWLQGGRGRASESDAAAPEAVPAPARVSWTHNLSVLHYFADLWARYLARIRPTLARGGLVLCDRYFTDLLTQGVVLCRNPALRAILLALAPRPSLTLVLSGDPGTIAARKGELSEAETARHLRAFDVLRGRPGHLELDALKPVEENAEAVLRALFPGWSRPPAR